GAALEVRRSGVDEVDALVEVGEIVGNLYALVRTRTVDVQAPNRREQIGAECDVRTAAALQLYEHLRERFGDQVVDVRSADQLPGHPVGRLAVAFEELSVGSLISRAYARDQLGVARRIGLRSKVAHGVETDLSATYDGTGSG